MNKLSFNYKLRYLTQSKYQANSIIRDQKHIENSNESQQRAKITPGADRKATLIRRKPLHSNSSIKDNRKLIATHSITKEGNMKTPTTLSFSKTSTHQETGIAFGLVFSLDFYAIMKLTKNTIRILIKYFSSHSLILFCKPVLCKVSELNGLLYFIANKARNNTSSGNRHNLS